MFSVELQLLDALHHLSVVVGEVLADAVVTAAMAAAAIVTGTIFLPASSGSYAAVADTTRANAQAAWTVDPLALHAATAGAGTAGAGAAVAGATDAGADSAVAVWADDLTLEGMGLSSNLLLLRSFGLVTANVCFCRMTLVVRSFVMALSSVALSFEKKYIRKSKNGTINRLLFKKSLKRITLRGFLT